MQQWQYEEIADIFGTDLAIAEWNEPFYPYYPLSRMPDDLKVVILTRAMIRERIYQQVIKEVLRLEQKYKNKRIKQSTLYEKAINIVIEKNQITIE